MTGFDRGGGGDNARDDVGGVVSVVELILKKKFDDNLFELSVVMRYGKKQLE